MAKDLLLPGSILSLHRSAVEKLLKAGNGDAALLYLCLTAGQNSGALPWGPDQVEAAQNTLLRLGLISSDTPVQPPRPEKLEDDRPPDYTTQDIAQAFQNDGGFKALVPAVEQMLGKVLSPADLKILYTLFDFLALPPEVILTLTGWCVEQAKQKGPGRKPTLTQIDPHSPAGYLSSLHPFRCTPHSGRETPPTPAGLHLGRGETLPGPLPGQSQSLQPIERPSHTKRQGEHRKNQWDQSLAAPLPVGITWSPPQPAGRDGPVQTGPA